MTERASAAYPYSVHVRRRGNRSTWWCGCGATGGHEDDRICRDTGLAHQQVHTEAYQRVRQARAQAQAAEERLLQKLQSTVAHGLPEGLELGLLHLVGDRATAQLRLAPGWTWDAVLDLSTTLGESS